LSWRHDGLSLFDVLTLSFYAGVNIELLGCAQSSPSQQIVGGGNVKCTAEGENSVVAREG
jgi:hypothetical protein